MTTSEKIKMLRTRERMTQTELGEKLGVKKNAVSKWECGRVDDIPTSKIKAMATLFGVPISYLVDNDARKSVINHDGVAPVPAMRKVPLIGTIACGTPILANENHECDVDMPEHISADFALRCKGDSMINARIFDGDVVYIRQQDTIENGEIAAVLIDEEATLKRILIYPDRIVLEPENPKYRPLVYWNEEMNNVHILGKAIAFTSRID